MTLFCLTNYYSSHGAAGAMWIGAGYVPIPNMSNIAATVNGIGFSTEMAVQVAVVGYWYLG